MSVLTAAVVVSCVALVLLACGDPRTREEEFFDRIADSFEASGLHVCQEVSSVIT